MARRGNRWPAEPLPESVIGGGGADRELVEYVSPAPKGLKSFRLRVDVEIPSRADPVKVVRSICK